MISLKEILNGAAYADQSKPVQNNLMILVERVNRLRAAYNKPMRVTSGLRTKADQLRIYAAKGVADASKVPMGSQHLQGGAVDFADADGKLKTWCRQNEPLLASVGLWCEHWDYTPTWLHVQIVPPKSGVRWFRP